MATEVEKIRLSWTKLDAGLGAWANGLFKSRSLELR